MKEVYILDHCYEYEDEKIEENRILGIYSCEENALKEIKEYKKLPGFKDYPDCFFITKYELDTEKEWKEGFVTVYYD